VVLIGSTSHKGEWTTKGINDKAVICKYQNYEFNYQPTAQFLSILENWHQRTKISQTNVIKPALHIYCLNWDISSVFFVYFFLFI